MEGRREGRQGKKGRKDGSSVLISIPPSSEMPRFRSDRPGDSNGETGFFCTLKEGRKEWRKEGRKGGRKEGK
jgi:hypothetical protein